MRMIAVNDQNDLYLGGDGNLVLREGLTACLQACAQAVQAQRGEMVLARDRGVPNFQLLWQGMPNLIQFEAALRTTILAVKGVISIASLTVDAKGGVCSYTAVIETVFGQGTVNG